MNSLTAKTFTAMGTGWASEKKWTYLSWVLQVCGVFMLLNGFFLIESAFWAVLFMITGVVFGFTGGFIGTKLARLSNRSENNGFFNAWVNRIPEKQVKYLSWALQASGFLISLSGLFSLKFSRWSIFIIALGVTLACIGSIIRKKRRL